MIEENEAGKWIGKDYSAKNRPKTEDLPAEAQIRIILN